ncbi:MAG: EFR1 family ferrodoxin [Anaeroplasma sp.]
MKFLLIYYTGTYNTRYLTNKLEEKLLKNNHDITKIEVNCNTKYITHADYDYIGLGYPIYGFNSPLPFNKYLRCLNLPPKQKYFIYKNSGEVMAINNSSSRVIKRIMKHKKASFCGEYHFVMPYNIHFRFDNQFVKEILYMNDKLLDILLHKIDNNMVNIIKSNFIYDLASFIVSIQKIGGNVNSFFYHVNMDKCLKCLKCVNDCPEKNIIFKEDKIKFKHKCDMCMRCSFYCPQDAIKIGFLNAWKVNGEYDYNEINKLKLKPYITAESKGFYKCFIKYFEKINAEYNSIFKGD